MLKNKPFLYLHPFFFQQTPCGLFLFLLPSLYCTECVNMLAIRQTTSWAMHANNSLPSFHPSFRTSRFMALVYEVDAEEMQDQTSDHVIRECSGEQSC